MRAMAGGALRRAAEVPCTPHGITTMHLLPLQTGRRNRTWGAQRTWKHGEGTARFRVGKDSGEDWGREVHEGREAGWRHTVMVPAMTRP